jgi:hypothetical protein
MWASDGVMRDAEELIDDQCYWDLMRYLHFEHLPSMLDSGAMQSLLRTTSSDILPSISV